MSTYLFPVLIAVQVLSAITIIVLVLLQQGKGADMGSSFGGGSAGSLFGSAGSANFFSRLTKWVAVVFFASTLGLAFVGAGGHVKQEAPTDSGSVMEGFSSSPSASPSTEGSAIPTTEGSAIPSVAPTAESAIPTAPQQAADVSKTTPAEGDTRTPSK